MSGVYPHEFCDSVVDLFQKHYAMTLKLPVHIYINIYYGLAQESGAPGPKPKLTVDSLTAEAEQPAKAS